MCGIVGCVGKIWKKEEDAFKLLLQLDTIRGPDSTGVLSVHSTDCIWQTLKLVGTPWELFSDANWGKLWSKTHRLLLGHNRWATVGSITNDNAHPFNVGDYIGVHNGTLRAQWRLNNSSSFKVDSENIYHNMNVEGVEETVKKLDGAFALVWYNAKDNTLQMCRNSERPLFVCKSEDGKTYFWASEAWMLRVALGKSDIKHSEPLELKVGELVTLKVPVGNMSDMEPLIPRIKTLELFKVPERNWSSSYHERGTANSAVKKDNVIPFVQGRVGSKELRTYLGKTVMFSVIGERASPHMDYILAEVEDMVSPDIRIFVTVKTKLGKLLMGSSKFFKGKVKGCTAKDAHGHYLTLDHRTIVEVEEQPELPLLTHQRDESAGDEDNKKMLPINNGRMGTLEQWYTFTHAGCAWCSDFPRVEQAEQLTWFAEDQFLCPTCSKDPNVMLATSISSRVPE